MTLPAPTEEDERYPIRIARDGTWYHEGTPIERLPLVRLFASVLRRDEHGDYWLITPAERGRIVVDDVPFVAVGLEAAGTGKDQRLTFRTNLDETVVAGPDHPLRVTASDTDDQPNPYILVRDGLEARIARAVYYDLVALAEERPRADGTVDFGVWSQHTFFHLGNAHP